MGAVDINRVFCSWFTVTILLLAAAVFPDSLKADTRTFFAFDDQGIPKQDNLQLTLVRPKKHPNNPVVSRGDKGAPDEWAVQFYGSVLRHVGKFKMWHVAADNESLELIKRGPGRLANPAPSIPASRSSFERCCPTTGMCESTPSTLTGWRAAVDRDSQSHVGFPVGRLEAEERKECGV